MVENKSSLFGIIAIIIGASGLGIGVYSVVNLQTVEGPSGEDAPGGLIIGILDPNDREIVSGSILLRAIIYGSENYTISVLRNGTEIGTSIPLPWDTTTVNDGWWNITVVIIDIEKNNMSSDEVLVYVDNTPVVEIMNPLHGDSILGNTTILAEISGTTDYSVSILRNGTQIGTSLPFIWDPSFEGRWKPDWYNITVIITDSQTGRKGSDEVMVFIKGYEKFLVGAGEYMMGPWSQYHISGDIIAEVYIEAYGKHGSAGYVIYNRLEYAIALEERGVSSYTGYVLTIDEDYNDVAPLVGIGLAFTTDLSLTIGNYSADIHSIYYTVRYLKTPVYWGPIY